MPPLDLKDIQGIILRGYGELDSASFLLLKFEDPRLAKHWLRTVDVRSSEERPSPSDYCANIAFTPTGLLALGLPQDMLAMFSNEFLEGMSGTPHRRRILGDHGESDPERWLWGAPANERVDVLLMLYASNDEALGPFIDAHVGMLTRQGMRVIVRLDTLTLPGRKEHFGFRDGIGQPDVDGYAAESSPGNRVAAGEFLFGHPNAYGQYTERPTVVGQRDPRGLLQFAPEDPTLHDFGMNGSYLVFRQLRQDVFGFWHYLARMAPAVYQGDPVCASVSAASKMVGRWPNGTPLVKSPHADPGDLSDDNDFLYVQSGDADGFRCAIGSHVRRCNPRDSLDPEPGSSRSLEVNSRHRIIRRGRAYGPPAAPSMRPEEVIRSPDDGRDRGLHFICFNTQIGRQFEFIQHTWANGSRFEGLAEDDDPLIGDRGATSQTRGGTFTIQQDPVRKRLTGMPRFVHVRGGSYFFMPSIRAVKYLAALE
jgi:Dyp-type peroxidase family